MSLCAGPGRKGDTVPQVLPEFPNLDQLRRQAKELLRDAAAGEQEAVREVAEISSTVDLSSAQLAIARRYAMASWPRLKAEVERKTMIQHGDVNGLRRLLARHPQLAEEPVSSCFENDGPLGYLGVARFHGLTDHDLAEPLTRVLLTAGAAPGGPSDSPEPPLITAASYGETEMVRALVEAGADLEATGSAVPGGTALAHAVEFGNVEVVDALAKAGAAPRDLVEAAGVGDVNGFLTLDTSAAERAQALRAAAICERLDVIDRLLGTGLSVDADPATGVTDGSNTVLHRAAYAGKPRSVQHLLLLGANPNRRDREYGSTPLGWCHHRLSELLAFGDHLTSGHREVVAILAPRTDPD